MYGVGRPKAITNARIILPDSILEHGMVVFKKKILSVGRNLDLLGVEEVIDAKGAYLSPGLIDVHMHGILGADVMDGSLESFERISSTLLRVGVTSFLGATMTSGLQKLYDALDTVRDAVGRVNGAELLGVYLEGPFISPKRAGAHDASFIVPPDFDLIRDYVDIIRVVAYAPELDRGFEFTNKLLSYGIVPSMGHTNATFEEAMSAIENGIQHVTHLFNAMTPFHHREPGAVVAGLLSGVSCELIADNVHISPYVYPLVYRLKGRDKLILVSDSSSATLMGKGVFELGGRKIFSDGKVARLEDGRLAGSVLTLNRAVYNFWKICNLPLYEAVRMATINPAKLIGVFDRKGSIEPGKDADMVLFDENFDVSCTVVSGEERYNGERCI